MVSDQCSIINEELKKQWSITNNQFSMFNTESKPRNEDCFLIVNWSL
jgi:hypothetical protein